MEAAIKHALQPACEEKYEHCKKEEKRQLLSRQDWKHDGNLFEPEEVGRFKKNSERAEADGKSGIFSAERQLEISEASLPLVVRLSRGLRVYFLEHVITEATDELLQLSATAHFARMHMLTDPRRRRLHLTSRQVTPAQVRGRADASFVAHLHHSASSSHRVARRRAARTTGHGELA